MHLWQSALGLEEDGSPYLAGAISLFIELAPALLIAGLLYLILPLLWDRRGPGAIAICRAVVWARRWNMVEVFLVGVFVSLLKLGKLATLTVGISFWAFIALIFCLTAALASIHPRRAVGPPGKGGTMNAFAPDSAAARGLALCHTCERVSPVAEGHCPRCGSRLHLRVRESLQKTWALTIAAFVLYFPANLLPILRVDSVTGDSASTIMQGVVQFWQQEDYPVAIIIFTASVMIPVLKIISIIALCLAARSGQHAHRMTKLYRVTEFIGRWSMVDVFVVAILVAVVQLGNTISIHPGAAALSFAGVVVLTMLAAMSFDPRLIWDAAQGEEQSPQLS